MPELMSNHQQRVYDWLNDLGADIKAVEFEPSVYLRKSGSLATPEALARVEADLVEMERNGWILVGQRTAAGYMVMVTDKMAETMLLPFERMLAVHAAMSDDERRMLKQWEDAHLGGDGGLATSDWPGWKVVVKRLAH